MGQAQPIGASAVIASNDPDQRDLVGVLLEECGLAVVECDTAETALSVLKNKGGKVMFLFTDLSLAGKRDGIDLAREVKVRWPHVRVVITSGDMPRERLGALPRDVAHLIKPWRPLDVLVEASKATDALRH